MNILYVCDHYYGGGAEKVARQLFEGMAKYKNVNTYFVEGRKGEKNDGIMYLHSNKFVFRLIDKIGSVFSNNFRNRDFVSMHKIKEIIEEKQIDIVHFHNVHGYYFGLQDLIYISNRCKVVWTLHDMWAFTGHCAYAIECINWRENGCKKCSHKEYYPKIYIGVSEKIFNQKKKLNSSNIDFVVPSNWLKVQLGMSCIKHNSISLINNGVNQDIFSLKDKDALKRKYNISTSKMVILCPVTNSSSKYKGFDVLLRAINLLTRKDDYFILLTGKKDETTKFVGIDVKWIGYVTSSLVMSEIYSLADLMILPSIIENFPCSILESMSSGTPVIGSDVGGIPEIINDDNGWLFECGNSQALCNLIESITKEEIEIKSKMARETIEKGLSEENMIEQYYQLYCDKLSK